MSHLMPRLARRGAGLGVACALAGAALVVPAVPASADAAITADEQTFYGYYRLDAIHSSGYTGDGVTIALIDGPVNTQIPELAGARIQSYSPCTVGSQDKYWDHGTVIAQVISSPQFGVAPGANLRAYTLSFAGDTTGSDCALGQWGRGYSDLALLIEDALNDGVDVITTSSSYPSDYEGMRWALARAIASKVPVVASTGNDSTRNSTEWLPSWGGVVGVGAIETNGRPSDYQNWGRPLSTAALARPLARSGVSQERGEWWGTSFASPTIASFLALAKQSWPEATGNQLLQALARTGIGGNGGYWNPYTGYGVVDPYVLLTTNPTQFPDENPFMNKGYESIPTRQDIADYADGLVDPRRINADDSYQYRGFDERLTLSREHGYPTHLGTSPRFHASNASNAKKK